MNQKTITALLAVVANLLVLQSAQAFPDRPIKLVVPSPAGGPPDQIARLLSDKMAAVLGQPVIVENRTGGAGGIIGAKSVATAEPDGYTLFMGSTSSVLIAPLIYKNAGYTAATFAPVARVAETPEMLALHPSVPANTVSELVRLVKSRPGALSYGSAGVGTLPHLEGEFLKTAAQIEMLHIPYRGGGQALTGLLGGEIQVLFFHTGPNPSTCAWRPPEGVGGDQRNPEPTGTGCSDHGGERVRSADHNFGERDCRATWDTIGDQAADQPSSCRGARLN
jgi:tripartite-type tricarboxylate transporter receptor subunit TctC